MSSWQYLKAIINKQIIDDPAIILPKTITPVTGLYERSVVEISPIPLLLASAGTLIQNIPGRHHVIAVGKLRYSGMEFYRAYLSNQEGTFIHIAANGSKILESRIYQPYEEKIIPYGSVEDAERYGSSADESWEFWLKEDEDPNFGGLIGCPDINGKVEDGSILYQRCGVSTGQRIMPIIASENILDMEGKITISQHQMMNYVRQVGDISEYLMVSAVTIGGESASLNMWLGLNIEISDLTVYPSAT